MALVILLIFQAYWLFGNAVTTEITKTDKAVDENVAKVALLVAQVDGRKVPAANGPEVMAPPTAGERSEMKQLDYRGESLRMRQSASYSLLETWATRWSNLVPKGDPTSSNPKMQTDAAHFQTALTVLDITQRYFLLLLYGFLGACVYVLRNLSDEIKSRVYGSHSDTRFGIRLYLGALGGIVAAWFVTPENGGAIQSLSPFALAFVAGYGVELLFAAMDKVISAFVGPPPLRIVEK